MVLATGAQADGLRLATRNADLSRDGPGLLLRDILSDRDADVAAVVAGLVAVRPDVVLLTRMDHDPDGLALAALAERLAAAGLDYPYRLAPGQNRGLATGADLNGNGRLTEAEDAQGYGRFSGDGAMAVLSRWPVTVARDHSAMLWADLPGARLAQVPQAVRGVQRLSSSAHWELAVDTPQGRLTLLAWAATPPLFDARNPDRNHDEAAFWLHRLEGRLGQPPSVPLVLMGLANLGPGQGDGAALAALAAHPLLHPPPHGASADLRTGSAGLSLIQPGRSLAIRGHGLHPPRPDPAPHRLVWVDVAWPP
jgi:hypothetical protein